VSVQPSMPQSFGRHGAYKVVEPVGRGGFATVYKAYHSALDRYVAIKVLRPEMVEPEGARNRFQIEARASARLAGHPNIVTVYDYGEEDGQAYLVLQFVNGETLEKRLHRPISALEVDRIITGVASALDFAHRHNLIHRDIKPSNVLLDEDGMPILSDFGIAKLLDATASVTNTLLGTPDYMSPEQITGSTLDGRSDVYALGVVVYRIFAGHPPFRGVPMSILHQHINAPPPPIDNPERPVPAAVEQVIHHALAKRPEERPATAGQLADELRAALKPLILADQAQEALRARDITRAETLVAELIRDHPSFPQGAAIQRQVQQWRQRLAMRARLASLVEAEQWPVAVQEIDRLGLRADDDPSVAGLVRRADAGLAAERARQEALRRAEQERLRQEALERERREHEAREAAQREQEARDAARREWEAQEAARREHEAREAARREEEARQEARRQWEAQEAERRERERREAEARETARREQEAREAARRQAEAQEAARLERERQERAEQERQERERREQEARDRQAAEARERGEQATRELDRPSGGLAGGVAAGASGGVAGGVPLRDPDSQRRELERLERIEALRREIDEDAGLPPEEIEARAAERHRRDVESRGLVEVERQARSEEAQRSRPYGPLVVIVALLIVAGVGALAFAGLLPGLGLSPMATSGLASGQPTAAPTQLVQSIATATGAPAKPTVAPAKPTTGPAQATPAPTTVPAAQPTAPPAAKPTSPPAPQPTQPPAPQPTQPPAAKPTAPPAPLPDTITVGDAAQMRLVPAGDFVMGDDGDPSAAPKNTTSLPAFYIDRDEVSNGRFGMFVGQTGYQVQGDWHRYADSANFDPQFFDVERITHPVVNVTWNDAAAYCQWAGKRLPFEAEWEKAARGTDGRRWPWGNEPHPELANVENNSDVEPDTKQVGSYPQGASPYGLMDMAGNAREWTASALQSYPLPDPLAGTDGASRVTRGGSWLSLPNSIEVSRRLAEPVGTAAKDLGFRCAVSADQATGR
jgi:formylglycine-generating enzyme required for sulfatase activity